MCIFEEWLTVNSEVKLSCVCDDVLQCEGEIREISRKFRRGPYVKTDIVTRELKIFWNGLHEMNSMIILDSPVEYLGNVKSDIFAYDLLLFHYYEPSWHRIYSVIYWPLHIYDRYAYVIIRIFEC